MPPLNLSHQKQIEGFLEAQNLSLLKMKSAIVCLSPEPSGLRNLPNSGNEKRAEIVVNLPLLELALECLDGLLAGLRGLESLLSDDVLEVKIVLHSEAGGEQVGVVDELDERLDLRLAVKLLLRHSSGDLSGRALDASNKSVTELAVLLALINLLDDNSLLTRASAGQQDDDAAFLHAKTNGPNSG